MSNRTACGNDVAFDVDTQGDEVLVMKPTAANPYKGENRVVMMQWEKEYMEACVDRLELKQGACVCEIGFGLGYSADHIQAANPAQHCIVECSSAVLLRLEVWARDKPSVSIIRGFWQDQLPSLSAFDAIFYDDFPLPVKQNDDKVDDLAEVEDLEDISLFRVNLGLDPRSSLTTCDT